MPTEPLRLIAHLDMDAFYASVELLRYPELRGKAVVIGGGRRHQPEEIVDPVDGRITRSFSTLRGYVGRGVITTATYEARALGLHSAQGLMKAAQLAPDAILLPTDFDRYREYSRRFKSAVQALAPQTEDRGIDEIYIDLTGVELPEHDGDAETLGDLWWRARDVAKAIKERVRAETELDKPDGLTMLAVADVAWRIWPLPAGKINGIGPKASARLEALGVRSIGELAHADPAWLIGHFGKSYGAWLHEASNGRDDRPVETSSEPKSISRETTFERDLHPARDRAVLSEIFTGLCVGVADDLRRKGYVGKTIGLKLRYDDFRTVTRDQTIPAPTQDARTIRRAAGECLKRVSLDQRIRLLGVRVGSLYPVAAAGDSAPTNVQELVATLFDQKNSG